MKIAISEIKVGKNWSREELGDISSLVSSLEHYGLIQPVVLDINNNLVAGFRRLEAAKVLGWTEIEYTITLADSPAVLNLIENIERQGLTFYQEACALKELFPGCNDSQISTALGRTTGWTRPRTKLWTLDEKIIDLVRQDKLSPSQVAMLIASKDPQATMEKILGAGKVDPTSTRPSKKDLREALTKALEQGKMELVQGIRYALGDISFQEVFGEKNNE
jgi:ParB/RepB/Spo0J family partition protein